MLIMSMSPLTDQPTVGKAVAAQGAGKVLRKNATSKNIRDALDELLQSGSYHAAAAKLGARIRATDGASAAADQLQNLIEC